MFREIAVHIFVQLFCYTEPNKENGKFLERFGENMKGYFISDGYMGFVNGRYLLFASEADYREYMEDQNIKRGAYYGSK